MQVGLKVVGASGIAGALDAMREGVGRPVLVEALRRAAEPMRARMSADAPRSQDAPHLADHIAISEVRAIGGVALDEYEAAVAIGPTGAFFYGSFLEFGWVHHPQARPFVRPAFDEGVEKATQRVALEIRGALGRAASTRSTTGGTL